MPIINLTISLLDYKDKIKREEHKNSIAKLEIVGEIPDIFEIKGEKASNYVDDGVYIFNNLEITLKPTTSVTMKLVISNYESFGEEQGFLNGNDPYLFTFMARECKKGELYTFE